jgi:hypothetical protein
VPQLTSCSLMWVCTTALLLCNAKKSRSDETDSPPLPVASRLVNEHTEKQQTAPNPWDEATASTVRDRPQPLLPSPSVSPEVEIERRDMYFQSRSSEQPPGTTQVPPPWASYPTRVSGGGSRQTLDRSKAENYLAARIGMPDHNGFQLPTTVPTDRGIPSRRKSK